MTENVIYAHIFGRRKKGNREEAKLVLFTEDGTPFVPGSGSGGPPGTLTDLTDVTGTPGIGKAPVSDQSGAFPLTEVATQVYVDQQVSDALSRWATLREKLSFVSELNDQWAVTNPSVVMTPDGLVYGPYADGVASGGSIRFHGMDGQPLSSVRNLA